MEIETHRLLIRDVKTEDEIPFVKLLNNSPKQIDYFHEYGIIRLVVSPTAKWTAKSVSNYRHLGVLLCV